MWLGCNLIYISVSVLNLIAIVLGSRRARNTMVASDRLLNAATGGRDTETMSSRAYRGTLEGEKHWCMLCRILDFFQKDHCEKSKGI
jgi:hypothetical protein